MDKTHIADVQVQDEDTQFNYISLSKLTGKRVVDVQIDISLEFGDPTLRLHGVRFEDGSYMYAEGEHDFPYLTVPDHHTFANVDEDTLQRLYCEDNPDLAGEPECQQEDDDGV